MAAIATRRHKISFYLGGARLLTSRPLRTVATAREDARPTNEFFI